MIDQRIHIPATLHDDEAVYFIADRMKWKFYGD